MAVDVEVIQGRRKRHCIRQLSQFIEMRKLAVELYQTRFKKLGRLTTGIRLEKWATLSPMFSRIARSDQRRSLNPVRSITWVISPAISVVRWRSCSITSISASCNAASWPFKDPILLSNFWVCSFALSRSPRAFSRTVETEFKFPFSSKLWELSALICCSVSFSRAFRCSRADNTSYFSCLECSN